MAVTAIVWFRRDLRLADHPALVEAAAAADAVVALFVSDPRLRAPAGSPRLAFLAGCLTSLDQAMNGHLVVRTGDPATVVPRVAAEVGAQQVYISDDFGRYGHQRDDAVEAALVAGGRRLARTGSPYAIDPGTVLKRDGEPFSVFSPFYRAWQDHGWAGPVAAPRSVPWAAGLPSDGLPSDGLPSDALPSDAAVGGSARSAASGAVRTGPVQLPRPGERAAMSRLETFMAGQADHYAGRRDEPGADATTRLSPYLKFGCLHPRQILDRLDRSASHEKLRRELAWREFYADVLWHRPDTAFHSWQPVMAAMRVDTGKRADDRFAAWAAGRTGYPLVDAGMRQLLAEAWMPNRVRMVVASFLVKDLHLDWARGARWFLRHLVDGDLASNNHGWQWVAGTGTDPAPYFRIFNPTTQAKEHDPDGRYIRRWVPELAGLGAPQIFEPSRLPGGPPNGYPAPIVVHRQERVEALARFHQVRAVATATSREQ